MSTFSNEPRPYSQIRRDLIAAISSPHAKPRKPPARPAGLDTRLSAAAAAKLRELSLAPDAPFDKRRDLYDQITMSIFDELEAIDEEDTWFELLTPGRRAIRLVADVDMEVNNGGFDQYYLNSSGDGAILAPAALRAFGFDKVAALVEQANSVFPKGKGPPQSRETRLNMLDSLSETATDKWNKLDSEFFDLPSYPDGALSEIPALEYVLAHEAEFFKLS